MKNTTKTILTHVACIVTMLVLACIYFKPMFDGRVLQSGDLQSAKAMTKENHDFHEQTGEYANWNSSMFCGFPNYQVGGGTPAPATIRHLVIRDILGLGGNSNTIGGFFLYLIGFYIALICFGISPWLALLGACAFGLGSYNLIIIHAGHITKANCLSLVLPILIGFLLTLKSGKERMETGKWPWGKLLGGAFLFAFALMLQLMNNHVQITYYTAIGCASIALIYVIYSIKEKWIKHLILPALLLAVGSVIAVGCDTTMLYITKDYAKYTMRGGSEISVTPDDLYKDSEPKSDYTSTGLSIDYAYMWSYGIGETYTLLVPGAIGGGSNEPLSHESASYKAFHQDHMPLYWGDQPFTDGPVYFGAIVVFLFLLGLFVVKGPERWWLLIATIIAVVLAWGRNFMVFNEWAFNNLPLYNKFRTPSMSLTLANVAVAFMAVLALRSIIERREQGESQRKRLNLYLYISGGITAGVILIGLLLSGGFSYTGGSDVQMAAQYGKQWESIQNVFIQDRQALFVSDSWRSLIFVLLAFSMLWLYINKKIKNALLLILPLTLLIVIDLWNVDQRYLNDKSFVKKRNLNLFPSDYDNEIDRQAALYGDEDYRVLNLHVNTFNDAMPSAFHHQIGGYSAVKLRRYQDIIDFYISRHINWNVLNMLNARYIVTPQGQVQRNPDALGNAWFVSEYRLVPDANAEILALNDINPAQTAIIDSSKWAQQVAGFTPTADTANRIVEDYQKPYHPGYLRYNAHCTTDQLAVFSEVFHAPDWFAYIDGKPAEYMRANYILRAMVIPAGDHVIEFRNEAPMLHKLNRISIACQILLLTLGAAALAWVVIRKYKKKAPKAAEANKK